MESKLGSRLQQSVYPFFLSRDCQGEATGLRPTNTNVFRGQSASWRTGGGMERMDAIKHIARQRGLSKREVYQAGADS